MDKATAYRIHQEWIDESLESDRLSDWEDKFLKSIKEQLEKKGFLSPKQIEVLERIHTSVDE
jgi:hypothetical protein